MMSDVLITGICIISLLLLLFAIRLPVGFSLLLVGFCGIWYLKNYNAASLILVSVAYNTVSNYVLISVPLFILMGHLSLNAGLAQKAYSAGFKIVGGLPGGLAMASSIGCGIFAAATGIVGASVTILGIMAAKSMNKSGYDVRLSAGTITAGGTLGILIPPSIMLVVMGPIMEIPVTDLFAAAIIPGILLASLYAAYVTIRCWINPSLGPVLPEELRATSIKAVWIEFFLGLVPPAALVFAALGSILFGFATPTEAAGMGAMGSLILALAYRKLSFKKLQNVLVKTLEISALIMVLVAASNFFGSVFSRLGTPMLITEVLLNLEMNRYIILAIVMAMIFLLGWPLEWVPIVMIIIPIILPLIEALGFNLTWFAILVAVNLQKGI